jgi:hypothetical protein
MNRLNGAILCTVIFALWALTGCIHDPVIPEGYDPIGPTGPTGPTGVTGPTGPVGNPCDPDLIYFEIEVQPLLSSSCAVPLCHDAVTAEDGVILETYASTMATADVRPGDPESSDIYEVLVETDPDKVMPPPSSGIVLTIDQIAIIREWIAEGANNLQCDPYAGGCDTVNVTFSGTVWPVIANNCRGCHSGNNPQGGVSLTNYSEVKLIADDGRLASVIAHEAGFTPMPFNQPQLGECQISQILKWIGDGAPDN